MASPSALRPTCCRCQQPLSQKGSGAWDLTSDARPAFRVFSVVPDQLPNQARTHDDVPISGGCPALRPAQIHTPSCTPLAGMRSFRSSVTRLPSHPTHRRTFTLDKAPVTFRLVAALGFRTSDLYHLPIALTAYRGSQLGADA